MRLKSLAVLTLLAALIPAAAGAQSSAPDQDYPGPGMMWGSQGNGWMGQGGYGGAMRGCPMFGGGLGMGMNRGQMMGGGFARSSAAWLDGQLAYAHTELAITAAQEPSWKAYADSLHARNDQMLSTHQSMMAAMTSRDALPFDQAYDLHIQVMETHLAAMKANRDAALKLYQALTAEQRKKASWVLPPSLCGMM